MFESIPMPIMRKGLVVEKIKGEKENRADIDYSPHRGTVAGKFHKIGDQGWGNLWP